jgi:predicted dehydrogenase
MRVLVIGLGSMGKRRVRNLKANGINAITGYDTRRDRCDEAIQKYNIEILDNVSVDTLRRNFDAVVISTPPNLHMKYAFLSFEARVPMFIEASVTDPEKIDELDKKNKSLPVPLVIAPSCTMRYFPGPKLVKKLVADGSIGKALYFSYVVGQYLPDWHPWESIQDYYVSIKETGGGREILPFELTWLNDLWGGEPKLLNSFFGKLSQMDADIDDFYNVNLRFPSGVIGNLTIEVLSLPKATREMRIIGEKGIIHFSGDHNTVTCSVRIGDRTKEEVFELSKGSVESQYINPEEPYIEEIKDFLNACQGKKGFPNTLQEDVVVLRNLIEIEKKASKGFYENL